MYGRMRRTLSSSAELASAVDTASAPTMTAKPPAYARYTSALSRHDGVRAALAVTARNGPTVQDSEASANPTPYPSMDPNRAVGAHREPGRTGPAADLPASHTPQLGRA